MASAGGSDNEDDKPAFGSPEEAARREAMNSLMGTKLSAVVTEVSSLEQSVVLTCLGGHCLPSITCLPVWLSLCRCQGLTL